MKLFFSSVLVLVCQMAFGQKIIEAKDAYKYINQRVIVIDSVYSAQIYQDSIAVMGFGKPDNPHPLTIILIKKAGAPVLDKRVTKTLQAVKVSFKGLILSNGTGVLMILNDLSEMRFEYRLD